MSKLEDSIKHLYEVFAIVTKPQNIDDCPCCIERKNISVLLSTSLRSIPPDAISSYASSAFLTVGDISDYLYFLPRILEISATEDFWWPDIEVTGRAIHSAEPTSWTKTQYDALNDFLIVMIDSMIQSENYHGLDGWLCAIGRMGLDIRLFLERVEMAPDAILGYFEQNANCLTRNKLCNNFWELPSAGHDSIVRWFKTDPVRKVLFETYGYVSEQ